MHQAEFYKIPILQKYTYKNSRTVELRTEVVDERVTSVFKYSSAQKVHKV